MSEPGAPSASNGPPPRARRGAGACGACLVVLLLLAGAFGLATWGASRSLDRRAARLRAELEALNATLYPPRAPLLGEALRGNAADDLEVLVWVLGSPPDMTEPAGAAATGLERDQVRRGVGPAVQRWMSRMKGGGLEELLDGEAPLDDLTRSVVEHYRPLTRVARRATRRERCAWGPLVAPNGSGPWLHAGLVGAMLCCEARDESPDDAARTGLEVVALGRDVARKGGLDPASTGASLERCGARVVTRALRRGPSRATCALVLDALGRVEPIDVGRALRCDRLRGERTLAGLSGRPLAPGDGAATGPTPADDPAHRLDDLVEREGGAARALAALGPVFFEREWGGWIAAMDGAERVAALPSAERERAFDALREGLSGLAFASGMSSFVDDAADACDAARVDLALARVIAAAHLHRLDTGAFPDDLATLAPRLGGVPLDPFAPAGTPLRLSRSGDELRAWSVGRDHVDGGGLRDDLQRGDLVHVTRAPAKGAR